MKIYQTKDIRNIALIGSSRTGKTTLAETMLLHGGLISRRGSVEEGNTVSDYRDEEIERAQSIESSLLYSEFQDLKINIIDCPGVDDFVGKTISAIRVADTAFMVLNAHTGIDAGTKKQWRWTRKMNTPVVFVINQLDHQKANFENTLTQLKESVGHAVILMQYPLNVGLQFDAVIDLLQMKLLKFPVNGGEVIVQEIPPNEKEKADKLHKELVEAIAENEEDLMNKFFENGTLSEQEIALGLRVEISQSKLFPVLCCAAKTDQGVQRILQFIKNNCPSPLQIVGVKTTTGKDLHCNPNDSPIAYVFKTTNEPHLGEISFLKIYGGKFTEAMDVYNPNQNSKEHLSQLLVVAGKNRARVSEAFAGDIVATVKLKHTHTSDTLIKTGDDIIVPTIYPEPKFRIAIKAKNEADDQKLTDILALMAKTDKTFIIEYSKELKQIILHGQGEQQINLAKWIIEKINKIEIEFAIPKIPYRETITKSAEAMYRHKKQSGGAGQFGEVHLMIEPYHEGMPHQSKYTIRGTEVHHLPWGGKLVYQNCIVGGSIDTRFLPAILKGIMERMEEGPLTGSYARDIVVSVYDGKMHPVDSNEISFKLAGRHAFKEAFKNATPKILEPIYNVTIIAPADKVGDVMTDLQSRRSLVMGIDADANFETIKARIPLAEMDRYSTILSSITSGSGTYSMKFFEYQQVPSEVQNTLLKAYETQEDDE